MTLRWKNALALGALALVAAASPAAAAGSGPYSMTVLVDGVPAPEYAARGRIYLEALKGRNFSILLGNPTGERVAVALSVDGRNVIDAKRTSAGNATKWILAPGETAEIPGWQVSGQTARRFFFTETRRSYAKWLGDTANVGTIEAVFYRERLPVAWPRPIQGYGAPGAAEEPQRAERQAENRDRVGGVLPAPPSDLAPGEDHREAKARSRADAAAPSPAPRKEADSYAATGIGDQTRFEIQWVRFQEDPTPAGRIALRYEFRTELVALGILPREDNLYARDRGRGFEREYAPDPYRHR